MTTYQINNPITGTPNYIDGDETQAKAKLAENIDALMYREGYRFTMATVISEGVNTTWRAPVDSDPEVGTYMVFNQWTGQHEEFSSLSGAHLRIDELKQQFISECGLDKFTVVQTS